MGIRGELFSTKVVLQNRTYFFNVKENRMGDLYLNIVESKNRDTGGFERQSVILFAGDMTEFLQGFDESLRVMEKAEREKRRGKARAGSEDPRERGRGRSATADNRTGTGPSAKPKVKAALRVKTASKPGPGNKEKRPRRVVVSGNPPRGKK
jgi:hypothetical protein